MLSHLYLASKIQNKKSTKHNENRLINTEKKRVVDRGDSIWREKDEIGNVDVEEQTSFHKI